MAATCFGTPIPEEFRTSMKSLLSSSEESNRLCDALDGISPVAIRLNRYKPADQPYPASKAVPWCGEGYYLSDRPVFTLNPMLHAGTFYVQEPASMIHSMLTRIAAEILGNSPLRVLDLCAAPGGKTTAVINTLPEGSSVIANEFSSARASILCENLVKYGYPDICVTNCDARRFSDSPDMADLVIVDAPCSGEGMMRKEETARTQWNEGLIRSCATLQREILDAAITALVPGGIIIYSTCTFNKSENEENVRYLIDNHKMIPVDIDLKDFPELRHGMSDNDNLNKCCIRFFPHLTDSEGLFVAMLRKPVNSITESDISRRGTKKRKNSHRSKTLTTVSAETIRQVTGWLEKRWELTPVVNGNIISAISDDLIDMTGRLPSGVRVLSSGVELGTVKGKDIIPSHALALSTALNRSSFPIVNLSEEEAVRYLQRENISLPESTPKGFVIIAFRNITLGFVKNIGSRCNNLYPSEFRIRMRNKTDVK